MGALRVGIALAVAVAAVGGGLVLAVLGLLGALAGWSWPERLVVAGLGLLAAGLLALVVVVPLSGMFW